MNKKGLIIFILYFLFSIGVNLVHPVTTTYVDHLNLPDSFFGFFYSLMSLGQVIGALMFGVISDKIGRKALISLGLIGYALSQAGFGFVNENPYVILIFRVTSGIFISAPSTLFIAACLDECRDDNRIKMLSYLSAASILGTSVGYEISGSLYNYANFKISDIFILQIIFCILIGILSFLILKNKNREKIKSKISFKSIVSLSPTAYIFLFGFLLLSIGQILISKYLDTYIIHIGYEPSTLGHYVLISGLVGAFANFVLIPLVLKIKNLNRRILLIVMVSLSFIFTLFTFNVPVTYILIMLFSTHLLYMICKSMITPLEQYQLSKYSNDNGKIMGARQTIYSLGNVIGPLFGSLIYQAKNPTIFNVSALFILFSLIIFVSLFVFQKKKNID